MHVGQLIGPELRALLEEDPSEVRAVLAEIHPEDLADVVRDLGTERATKLLLELPTEYAAQVFERLDEDLQRELAESLGTESAAVLALQMDPDDRADFLSVIPDALSDPILREIEEQDPEIAEEVQELQQWPETSAGGLMTTDYVEIRPRMTITEATAEVRKLADDAETIDTLFVTDEDERLLGVLPLRDMLLAQSGDRVDAVMGRNFISVLPDLDQEEVASKLAKYDLNALPVVSAGGQLLGVITSDDILDVLTKEQNEDAHLMAAVGPLRDGYFDTSFLVFVAKRAPWLLVLFLGGFLTTQTLQGFAVELATITQLAVYLPLLISAGGNSGAQSSTLIIRGLAVGDIAVRDWWRVLIREGLQGITLGSLMALLGVGRSLLAGDGPQFAILVGATIVTIVVLGCVLGGMMPILLHRLGLDPATSSTPFIASVVDVLGVLVYLSLARLLLSGLASVAQT
jgi:magnesium transporter